MNYLSFIIALSFHNILKIITLELQVVLLAMVPVIELRGAIPYGVALGLKPLEAGIFSYLGSIIPAFIILYYIEKIFSFLQKSKFLNKVIHKINENSLAKSHRVKKYGLWGLFLFVAIPLPGTGVWTGSLIAVLLRLVKRDALVSIILGNLVAGLIILSISYSIFN